MDNGSSESVKNVVARYFDMWNTGDASVAAQILSPDWVDHAHPEVKGPQGVQQAVQAIRAARLDLHFHIDAILGDDDLVAVVGAVGSPLRAAGSPSRLIWLVRLKDGRMTEMWTYQENRA